MYAKNDSVLICAATKSTYTSLLNVGDFLAVREGCRIMVFMINGMKSATTLWTFCLYNWYMSTTMMGNSASTLSEFTAFGINVCCPLLPPPASPLFRGEVVEAAPLLIPGVVVVVTVVAFPSGKKAGS